MGAPRPFKRQDLIAVPAGHVAPLDCSVLEYGKSVKELWKKRTLGRISDAGQLMTYQYVEVLVVVLGAYQPLRCFDWLVLHEVVQPV